MSTKTTRGEEEEEEETALHGDILKEIISHIPTLDLLTASWVSKAWRHAVSSTLDRRRIPWLILHLHSYTFAYDPNSHTWIPTPHPTVDLDLLTFSHPGLLYTLTFSRLAFSTDAFAVTWTQTDAPSIWRSDPIVALVGPHLVVAGGTCDYTDDPCAVEVLRGHHRWETCQTMPDVFKDRAAATWLSVAVSDMSMYVLDRNLGWFCEFNPEAGTWGAVYNLLEPGVFVAAIGVSGGKVVMVGATGSDMRVEGVVVWEVDRVTMGCREMGRMPAAMVERLVGAGMFEIGVSLVGRYGYLYNLAKLREVVLCELGEGWCRWEIVGSPAAMVDEDAVMTIAVGCSVIGMGDLAKLVVSQPGGSGK